MQIKSWGVSFEIVYTWGVSVQFRQTASSSSLSKKVSSVPATLSFPASFSPLFPFFFFPFFLALLGFILITWSPSPWVSHIARGPRPLRSRGNPPPPGSFFPFLGVPRRILGFDARAVANSRVCDGESLGLLGMAGPGYLDDRVHAIGRCRRSRARHCRVPIVAPIWWVFASSFFFLFADFSKIYAIFGASILLIDHLVVVVLIVAPIWWVFAPSSFVDFSRINANSVVLDL